ncbi:hypothetical protein MJO28_014778 [Puccinia striiformis f. sp. tritici]|uniref:Secreted protein n=2 Tax=Puccinia striiformis f. sp. tritici TaxID=168172 RepID=A0A0L0VSI1_9BASI|nr:hypothetical protein Pst134EA_027130 [Puccinia striiformis f. sp. tritici]KNF02243.1 hypothetical protein PSTG_04454 [Puccinia striiformis f. sp. tritici PST-78]KAH9443319.1 hypothetical protein Pst134EB_027660 [Puccinia striiformis f. sp. tritici]KAH9450430.1 hypothetical protein Pst134EA_027130 [Puccinia striiformis f. sp. tritici]KAI7939199.1 hypothetical protein MJO28_014778 [Puccinia striiformis f. sp. tritici]KAI7939828.1 hypothetical protein MJO29_014564 [Puccinia striiformis f. sp. 
MNFLALIICLACAATPAVLAARAPTTPDPKTTVAFTCADARDRPIGWCVSKDPSKPTEGYNYVLANRVGLAGNLNYNCIGKPFGDNSMCCILNFKPKKNGLTMPSDGDCQIKK